MKESKSKVSGKSKIIIIVLSIFLVVSLYFIAVMIYRELRGDHADEPISGNELQAGDEAINANPASDYQANTEETSESTEVEEDIVDEAMPLHIVGTWTFAKAELEDGTEFEHWEVLADLEIEIRSDGTIRYVDEGTIQHSGREDVVEGVWMQIDEYNFEFTSKTNICLCCGEYETEPADSYLRYDPITDLLEHFGHNYAEQFVRIHVFFERVH